MGQILHSCARTTAAVRRAIQHSQESLLKLAERSAQLLSLDYRCRGRRTHRLRQLGHGAAHFRRACAPAGVTAALPGALNCIFNLASKMKLSTAYTEAIGTDLGIVGAAETEKPTPKFFATPEQGDGCQCVKIGFYKYGHMGVYLESRRGTSAFEFLTIDTESPYDDERPLLAAGQPELREYGMRFWDKGTPNGDWTDVVEVTVSPMPFDPSKPAANSPNSSAEMRAQLTALNADIQTRATAAAVAAAISSTSNNSNGVTTLGQGADGSCNQSQMQDVLTKLDELINALRR